MKQAEDERRDAEEETQREREQVARTAFVFALTALEMSVLQKTPPKNESPTSGSPFRRLNTAPPASPRKRVWAFISHRKLLQNRFVTSVRILSLSYLLRIYLSLSFTKVQ